MDSEPEPDTKEKKRRALSEMEAYLSQDQTEEAAAPRSAASLERMPSALGDLEEALKANDATVSHSMIVRCRGEALTCTAQVACDGAHSVGSGEGGAEPKYKKPPNQPKKDIRNSKPNRNSDANAKPDPKS